MDDKRPSTREWEGETRERNHYGVVLTNGNKVTQDQRRYTQGERIRGNGVPKDTAGGMWSSHRDTQHPVGASRGTGDGNTRLTAGQHRYRGPAGDKTHWRHSHMTELVLHGMGDVCR